jgi:integrase
MLVSRLSKRRIKNLPDGLHCDGRNLYLQVRGGSSLWLFRFKRNGRITTIGLGSLRFVSLEEARRKADELNRTLHDGTFSTKLVEVKRHSSSATFQGMAEAAVDYHIKMNRIRTVRYKETVLGLLKKHAFPTIGNSPVASITSKQLADILFPLWNRTIGNTVLVAIRLVFKYAVHIGAVKPPLPCEWNGVLSTLLPRPFSSKSHYSFIPWTDIPATYRKIYDAPDCVARRASLLAILLVPRINELLRMRGEDYDRQHKTLRIAKTKNNLGEFLVPLSVQAEPLVPEPIDGLLFHASMKKAPMHSQMVRFFLKGLGITETTHGFRSSFSTWCADNEKDAELRERCLQHAYGSKVTAAYQRSDLLERRRKLLQEWADYVTSRMPSR